MTLTGKSERLAGMMAMVVGVASFAFMDAGLKVLSQHYPPMQGAALRGMSALPIVFAWALLTGGLGQLLRVRWGLHLLRGALSVVMLTTFMYGLSGLSLAKAYAIFFIAPLLIVIFAIALLGERVHRVQWAAICVGFVGVLIAARPDVAGLGWSRTLAIFGTAVCYALSNVLIRIIGRTDSTPSLVFWMTCMLAIGATALALPDWQPVMTQHYPVIAWIAITGAFGQWGITFAFRHTSSASAATIEYSALAWGICIDFFVWSVTPTWTTLAGAAVIIASGIYLLRFETRRA